MYCVYIIRSVSLEKFYIGETKDLEERIFQHNSGFYNSAFSRKAKDWKLYFVLECNSRTQARKIEAHIKNMKSKKYIQNLKEYPEIALKLKNKLN
jgi:putative endonuclease